MATQVLSNPGLPAAVLSSSVFPFLTADSLKRCAVVCKEWKTAADEDVVWKQQCVLLWKKKRNVPRIVENGKGDEEPVCLYPSAIYPHLVKLSVKEMKQILSGRMVGTEKFLEKSEFQRALDMTQPTSLVGLRTGMFPSKWKCSFVYSQVRSKSDRITRFEHTQTLWRMEFKFNGMTSDSRFNGDGTYWSTLGNFNGSGELTWMFVPNSDGNVFDFSAVRVGDYPHLVVHRTKDWGYELHNDYVVFRQVESRPFV
jgi:hypothetical protein